MHLQRYVADCVARGDTELQTVQCSTFSTARTSNASKARLKHYCIPLQPTCMQLTMEKGKGHVGTTGHRMD